MAALPYMKLFVGDYFAATRHLTCLQHGAYLQLIMTYWQRGSALPNDDAFLAKVTGLGPREWQRIKPIILDFFEVEGLSLVHKRLERELQAAASKSLKSKEAGSTSARVRSNERSTRHSHSHSHSHSQSGPSDPLSPDKSGSSACDLFEDEPPDGGAHPDGELHEQCSPSFESWWTQYPNKVGKRKAATEYDQALKRLKKSSGPQVHMQLLAALVAQCAVWKRKGIVGRYIPHPATWLHQSRYMDAEVQAEVARPRPALLADAGRVDVVELTPAEPPPAKRETLERAQVVGWMPSDASER